MNDHILFDSEAVACIIRACDDAWNSLRGSIFVSFTRAGETRATILRVVIDMAGSGERDPARLREHALRPFGMA